MVRRVTRRRFVQGGVTLPWALRAMAQVKSSTKRAPRWVLLGTDKGKGIYRATWDPATGVLGTPELACETIRPAYFAAHPTLPILYAANESSGEQAAVSVIAVNEKDGTLKVLDKVPSHGDGPCYVSVNNDGSLLLVANYTGGSAAAIPLDAYGSPGIPAPGLEWTTGSSKYAPATNFLRVSPEPNAFDCKTTNLCGPLGSVKDRQDAPHLHCCVFAPGDDYALVCDLGDDAILVFGPRLKATSQLRTPMRVAAQPGSGPRHVAFHPNTKWVYCINELGCTVDLYDWEGGPKSAKLSWREGSTVSTLPAGAERAGNTACEVLVGDDGRFVYTCTRGAGSNSITVFAIDAPSGRLREQQTVSCGGSVPRYIGFDPSRRWLLCTNQSSSTVTVFAHEPGTGRLSETPKRFAAESPMCVAFA